MDSTVEGDTEGSKPIISGQRALSQPSGQTSLPLGCLGKAGCRMATSLVGAAVKLAQHLGKGRRCLSSLETPLRSLHPRANRIDGSGLGRRSGRVSGSGGSARPMDRRHSEDPHRLAHAEPHRTGPHRRSQHSATVAPVRQSEQ